MTRVGVLAGGGLSSWFVVYHLKEQSADVIVYVADVGQVDERCLIPFIEDMDRIGVPVRRIDLRDELGQAGLNLARYQVRYAGGYRNTTGMLRAALVKAFAPLLVEDGCDALAHGCVGFGNDQRRFEFYTALFARDLEVIAPLASEQVNSRFPTRAHMVSHIKRHGFDGDLDHKAGTSSDGSLLGVSHEGEALEPLDVSWLSAPFAMTRLPQTAAARPGEMTITFDAGQLTAIDGAHQEPRGALKVLNEFAGAHAIGLTAVVEDRINGTKCRGIYEAPGLTLLGFAYRQLYRATLPAEIWERFESLAFRVATANYQGRFFDSDVIVVLLELDKMASAASGSIRLMAHAGQSYAISIHVHGDSAPAIERRFASGGLAWAVAQPPAFLGAMKPR